MNTVWAHNEDLSDIGDAIREKLNTEVEYTIEQMAPAIDSIPILRKELYLKKLIERTITDIYLPEATTIGAYAFYNCRSLTTVNLPNVTSTIGPYTFGAYNDTLTTVNLHNATSIGDYSFALCYTLSSIDIANCTSIGAGAFVNCSALDSLTLSGNTVCTLGEYAFDNTPIASGTGYIYVPAELVDTYKAATNWSEYASQIVAIPNE